MENIEINLDEIIANGAIILDVRTKEEYLRGHIKGSLNLPLDEIRDAIHRCCFPESPERANILLSTEVETIPVQGFYP